LYRVMISSYRLSLVNMDVSVFSGLPAILPVLKCKITEFYNLVLIVEFCTKSAKSLSFCSWKLVSGLKIWALWLSRFTDSWTS